MRDLISAIVGAACLLVIGALFLVAVQKVREAASRMKCTNNLKQFGLAIHNHTDTYGHVPRATEPSPELPPDLRFSWQISVFPQMESSQLWNWIDPKAGWAAERNRFVAFWRIRYYQCPSSPEWHPPNPYAVTNYIGVAGVGKDAANLPLEHPDAGFFGHERELRFTDIKRGLSNMIAVMETRRVKGAWCAGGDPTVRGFLEDSPLMGREAQFGEHRGGANVLFADGAVKFVRDSVEPALLHALARIHGEALQRTDD